jgi:hypothetical protein
MITKTWSRVCVVVGDRPDPAFNLGSGDRRVGGELARDAAAGLTASKFPKTDDQSGRANASAGNAEHRSGRFCEFVTAQRVG